MKTQPSAIQLELLEEQGVIWPPTEEELPYDDGMPMETDRHFLQIHLLLETLRNHWADRERGYCGGNMFIYFRLDQADGSYYFRGPDFFAVLDGEKRERKSWVCWQEGMGPDVVIELLSASTRKFDQTEKKRIYAEQLRVPEYFWHDPFKGGLTGFKLKEGVYEPMQPDPQGRFFSEKLGLWLAPIHGIYATVEADWLRWMYPDGTILPTGRELEEIAVRDAVLAQQEAAQAQQEAAQAQQEAAQAQQEAAQAQQEAAHERERRLQAEQQANSLAARLAALEAEIQRIKTTS